MPVEGPSEDRRPGSGAVAPWWHTLLLIALLVGGSVLNARQVQRHAMGTHHTARYLMGMGVEGLFLLLVWWGLRMKRVPLMELVRFPRGMRALAEDIGAAAVFWIMAMAILAAVGVALRLLHFSVPQKTLMALAPRNALEMALWICLSAAAGFCEEVAFRGYFLRQFGSLAGGVWMGVICSSLLFGISHGYEGAAGMIAITAYGAMFCVLAIMRRSLRPGMIAHAWHDIFSGVTLALLQHFHPPGF
ncbi:MAG TPA: type II CAAX endopeptidase family protein [Acidobacteriaceae bacterium]|nr:type II CAAX endopeptidase family protein [Acidobacteriaceae bacterium]